MAMTREEMDRRMGEHFRFEATDTIEGVLTILAPGVERDVVVEPTAPAPDRVAATQYYAALSARRAAGKVECLRRLYGEGFLVDESLWKRRAPGRPFGLHGKGRPLEFRLLHVIEFAGNGDI